MALGDPYVTTAQLKVYLNLTDTVDDQAVTDAVNSASSEINTYCCRQFNDAGSASARVYEPLNRLRCEVDDFSTTTGLVIAVDSDGDGAYETTFAISDYQLGPLNGVVDGEPGWPYWQIKAVGNFAFPVAWTALTFSTFRTATVQVTANWGWSAVPKPVYQACLIMAAQNFRLKDAPLGVAGFGEFGVVRVQDVPAAARKLNPYRRDPVKVA